MCDVLLLEDNPDALERVRMALELRGHVVRISWKPDRTLCCRGPEGPASRL